MARRLLLLAAACGAPSAASAAAAWTDPCEGVADANSSVDHSILDRVLGATVKDGEIGGITSTLVTYDSLREDPSGLRNYLKQLCHVDVSKLPAADALAVLLNAYNAMMLAIIVHYNPEKSVLQLNGNVPGGGQIWKHAFITLGGKKVSLDNVEHDMVRNGGYAAAFNAKGRIHAAVNCASLSCPDLQKRAFHPETLDQQLTDAARGWLANPSKNPGPKDGKLVLSHIFKWYGGDFVAASGSIQAWLRKYNTNWQFQDSAEIVFEPYDWSLNGVNSTGGFSSGTTRLHPAKAALAAAAATLALVRP